MINPEGTEFCEMCGKIVRLSVPTLGLASSGRLCWGHQTSNPSTLDWWKEQGRRDAEEGRAADPRRHSLDWRGPEGTCEEAYRQEYRRRVRAHEAQAARDLAREARTRDDH